MNRLLVALFSATMLSTGAVAGEIGGDWPSYGRDPGGQRYSPLDQINPRNVAGLTVAWEYHMNPNPNASRVRGPANSTTPLMVGGRMYVGTPFGSVVSLDATEGRKIWEYHLPEGDQPALRGVSYWPGDRNNPPRLIVPTQRGRLIALDAGSGELARGFGEAGVVNTRTEEVMNGFPDAPYGYSAPPAIYRNIIITGSRVQEWPTKGPSGAARAWDAVTGKLLWTFNSVPGPGERFHDTWAGDSWEQRSGANMWNMATVDEERGVVYLSFGAPAYDRYGGDRKGDNLFANSVVAVNATTGAYIWHFQTTRHDIWDLDQHVPPTLMTIRKDGREIPAIAVMNKATLLFLLDRTTGEPIFGVEERPVPASTVPGEIAARTQPFPLKPGILTRMSFDISEIAAGPPEHHAICKAIVEKGDLVGAQMYEPLRADRMSVRFPGGAGGPEWGGGTFDPTRGLYIFNVNEVGYAERLVANESGVWRSTTGGAASRFLDPATRTPCHTPPWGELIAVNVNTAEVAWRSVLGVTDHFPEGMKKTGRLSNGGPISTAGGVTFIAGTDDRRIRAFETDTGEEKWEHLLEHAAHATPITYLGADGRQYVAVVATGGSVLGSPTGGDSVMVFALPK